MQSPFSLRRFAPAFDYLGSPFSAFFRPLLLGFPLHTFVLHFFFLSAWPSLSFVRFYLASGYSASWSSFQLSSRFSSQRLPGAPSVLSFLRSFPFRSASFPVLRFRLLSVLFFFSALFPVFLTAAPRCSSVSFVPFVFPLPSRLISHAFLPVLRTWLSCIVSFRPSQFRSRSRSTGAHLIFCFWLLFRCSLMPSVRFHFLSV